MIKLYNADCLAVMKGLEDNSIDLIVTDPPYRTTTRGNEGGAGGLFKKKETMQGKIFKFNDISPKDYLPEFYRILKDGSHCYVMTNHVNLQAMLNIGTEVGFKFIKSLVWNKGNKIMGQYYMSQFEYILFFRKGKGVKINDCGTSDIIDIPNKKTKNADGKNLHDTEKPPGLMKVLIKNSSNIHEVVLDPFMGVGSAGLACQELERDFIGVEIDTAYFSIAKERIEQAECQQSLFKGSER